MANPAINIALIAAAQQQQALTNEHITGPLKKAGATSVRTAIRLDLSAKGTDKLLAGLVKHGHVRVAGDGRYWIDEAAVARSKAAASRIALIVIAFLLSATASLIALVAAFN
jgi:DNA-binding IclR family transcriptional regulator